MESKQTQVIDKSNPRFIFYFQRGEGADNVAEFMVVVMAFSDKASPCTSLTIPLVGSTEPPPRKQSHSKTVEAFWIESTYFLEMTSYYQLGTS